MAFREARHGMRKISKQKGGAVTQKFPILNATQVPQFRNRHWFRAMGAYSKF